MAKANEADDDDVPALTPDLARLAGVLLDLAAQQFGNHGCNDFELHKVPGFETREKRAALDLAEHTWNGDPEEHDPKGDHRYSADFALMGFCAAVLKRAAGPVTSAPSAVVALENATTAATDAAETAEVAARELATARKRAATEIGKLRAALARLEKAAGQ